MGFGKTLKKDLELLNQVEDNVENIDNEDNIEDTLNEIDNYQNEFLEDEENNEEIYEDNNYIEDNDNLEEEIKTFNIFEEDLQSNDIVESNKENIEEVKEEIEENITNSKAKELKEIEELKKIIEDNDENTDTNEDINKEDNKEETSKEKENKIDINLTNNIWEFFRRWNNLSDKDKDEILVGKDLFNDYDEESILIRFNEWEESKKIHIGDIITDNNREGICIGLNLVKGDKEYYLITNGDTKPYYIESKNAIKTGKSVDIFNIFKKD